MPYPDYRVFISSPGDMLPERTLAADTVERVNASLHGISLTAYLSDNSLYLAHQGPQAGISQTREFDLVICLFWKRMGTQLLPKAFDAADGRKRTGTEYEFETAVAAAQHSQRESGTPVPAVLVYRKTEAVRFNAEHVDREHAQYRALQAFFERWIRDVQGHYLGYANEFETSQQFTQMFERHLRDWLALQRRAASWDVATAGSPYRGLEVFEREHAAVYFGRDRCILEARARLKRGAANGWPVLWIVGASGSGKSSLLRAGLLPSLERSEGYLRSVVFKPSELGGNLLQGVAARLLDALPELGEGSFRDVVALATVCTESPASTAVAFETALDAWAIVDAKERALDRPPHTRIVVAVDQAEELLTARSTAEREKFVNLFRALLGNDRVWLILSFRSDFYATLQLDRRLLPLKDDAAQLDVSAPSPAELALMITEPARAAGLTLELRDDGSSLADEISRDTDGTDSLTILEFALTTLFEKARARDESVLLIDDYLQMGRAAGALSTASEQTLATLPARVQDAFPRVLREIAEINLQADNRAPTAKACAMDTFANDPEATQLVEALSLPETRLLSRFDIEGRPHLRVSHESLFAQWPRAREQIQRDARRLDARRRLQEDAELWLEAAAGEKSQRLLVGLALQEALDLRNHWKLSTTLSDYIDQSHAASKRRERLRRITSIVFGIVAVIAIVAALHAYRQQLRAEESEREGVRVLDEAAQRALGRMQQAMNASDMATSHAYLAESLRYRPTTRSLLAASYQIQLMSPALHTTLPAIAARSAEFSPDGQKIVTLTPEGSHIWDARSGQRLASSLQRSPVFATARFSEDGTRVIVKSRTHIHVWNAADGSIVGKPFSYDGGLQLRAHSRMQVSGDGQRTIIHSANTIQVFDVPSNTLVGTLKSDSAPFVAAMLSHRGDMIATMVRDGPIRLMSASAAQVREQSPPLGARAICLVFSPDDARVVARLAGRKFAIWDRASNTIVETAESGSSCASLTFSADSATFATIDEKRVILWRSSDGRPTLELSHDDASIRFARYSQDGLKLLTVGDDRTVRVWLLETGQQIGPPLRHGSSIETATFNADSTSVVTSSADGRVRLWDVRGGDGLAAALRHATALKVANFSANGEFVVTGTEAGVAQIWRTGDGQPVGRVLSHDEPVNDACFSPDGQHVLTASDDGKARLWNRQSGAPFGAVMSHEAAIIRAVFSADGRKIATASDDGVTKLWDASTQQPIGEPLSHEGTPTTLEFSPDGRSLLTTGDFHSVRLWDAFTGALAGPPLDQGDDEEIIGAGFSPDGLRILTATANHLRQWNSADLSLLVDRSGEDLGLMSAHFSPDGTRIATTTENGIIAMRDASTGSILRAQTPADSGVEVGAIFSPDGTRLLTAAEGHLHVLDAETMTQLGPPLIHGESVIEAKFSADGRRILSIDDDDGVARIWPLIPRLDTTTESLVESLYALSELRVEQDGRVDLVPDAELAAWKIAVAPAKNPSDLDRIIRWHLSDRSRRSISAFSDLPISQFMRQEIEWALQARVQRTNQQAAQILLDAYETDPSYPLILLALVQAGLAADHEALAKTMSLARLAASNDIDVVTRGAEILQLMGDADAAAKAADMALALDRNFMRARAVKAWAEEAKSVGNADSTHVSAGTP